MSPPSGGGSAGRVGYPAYIEASHSQNLDNLGVVPMPHGLTTELIALLGNSPYTVMAAYDPDADLALIHTGTAELKTLVDLLSTGTGLDTLIANVLDQTRIDDAVDAFADDFDDQLTSDVYPRFEGGMRDINAVISSAFVIGRALIEEQRNRQVAKYRTELNLKAFSDDALKVVMTKLEYMKAYAQINAEAYKTEITAKREEESQNQQLDVLDTTWNADLWKHLSNFISCPSGVGQNTRSVHGDPLTMMMGALFM